MNGFEAAFQSLFEINMGIRPGERVLVFSDIIRPDEALTSQDRERRERLNATAGEVALFAEKTYGSGKFIEFPATSTSGVEPPATLWRAVFGADFVDQLQHVGLLESLLAKRCSDEDMIRIRALADSHKSDVADIVIALANNSTSHTNFRRLACYAGARFASLPHFDPEMFQTSMTVEWARLATRTARLVEALNRAEWVHVTTPNGTDMMICKADRQAEGDDGMLVMEGSFGNLPAGEAYLAPLEGKSYGTMVIEWGPTRRLGQPLKLTVIGGEVTGIEGDDPQRDALEARFTENPACRNIAELGIGTNDKASRPDNVLEAEKILGTIHIALGDNTGFGGCVSAPFHEDYVFFNPTVTAILPGGNTQLLIDNGTMLVQPD